jgi:membrane associated rhomboid family serine protease
MGYSWHSIPHHALASALVNASRRVPAPFLVTLQIALFSMHDSPRALREPLNPERNELTSLVHRHDSPRLGDGAGGTFPESALAARAETEPAPEHTPVFTYLCILANVAMMVVSIWKNGWKFESFSDNPMYGPSSATLLSLGAKQADLIRVGQWWRLFAPQYLHAGLIHLAMNMNGLWNLGRGLEGEIGFLRIALLYTTSGVSGIVASSIFVPHVVGVGASGALYGLIGCLFADFAHNHKLIENKWSYFIKLVLSTAFGIALGLLPLVDNFAHVFGMIAGLFIGSILLVPKCGDCGYQARKLKQYTVRIHFFACCRMEFTLNVRSVCCIQCSGMASALL